MHSATFLLLFCLLLCSCGHVATPEQPQTPVGSLPTEAPSPAPETALPALSTTALQEPTAWPSPIPTSTPTNTATPTRNPRTTPSIVPTQPGEYRLDSIEQMVFVDPSHGWLIGAASNNDDWIPALRRTNDGGRTWEALRWPAYDASNARVPDQRARLYFVTNKLGWLIRDHNRIQVTHDGGLSWQPETAEWADYVISFSAAPGAAWTLRLVNEQGMQMAVYHSQAAGSSWERVLTLPVSKPEWNTSKIIAASANIAWIIGNHPAYSTDDGGLSWHERELPCQEWYRTLQVMRDGSLWLSCFTEGGGGTKGGQLYQSLDQGLTWAAIFPKEKQTTDEGKVYYSDRVTMPFSQNYRFVSAQVGLSSNRLRLPRQTHDGGLHWTETFSVTDALAYGWDGFMLDEQHWWLPIQYQHESRSPISIMSTQDGGASWEERTLR